MVQKFLNTVLLYQNMIIDNSHINTEELLRATHVGDEQSPSGRGVLWKRRPRGF